MSELPRTVLVAGGVGGARMAVGLARALPAQRLTVVVNVGDDDWFHGLRVCPDLDTVIYTLAGRIDAVRAWGVQGDTTHALQVLRELGARDTWMTLGDADLGLHLARTNRLREGATLTTVTRDIARAVGVRHAVLPVTDDTLSTRIDCDEGRLRFQQWFVERCSRPRVQALHFEGGERARLSGDVAQAVRAAQLVVFAPSNPWLSILPMLQVPGFDAALRASKARTLAVSPLVNGIAVKGPLQRLMADLRQPAGNAGIARFYRGLAATLVIDASDASDVPLVEASGMEALVLPTRIAAPEAAEVLARQLLVAGSTACAGG